MAFLQPLQYQSMFVPTDINLLNKQIQRKDAEYDMNEAAIANAQDKYQQIVSDPSAVEYKNKLMDQFGSEMQGLSDQHGGDLGAIDKRTLVGKINSIRPMIQDIEKHAMLKEEERKQLFKLGPNADLQRGVGTYDDWSNNPDGRQEAVIGDKKDYQSHLDTRYASIARMRRDMGMKDSQTLGYNEQKTILGATEAERGKYVNMMAQDLMQNKGTSETVAYAMASGQFEKLMMGELNKITADQFDLVNARKKQDESSDVVITRTPSNKAIQTVNTDAYEEESKDLDLDNENDFDPTFWQSSIDLANRVVTDSDKSTYLIQKEEERNNRKIEKKNEIDTWKVDNNMQFYDKDGIALDYNDSWKEIANMEDAYLNTANVELSLGNWSKDGVTAAGKMTSALHGYLFNPLSLTLSDGKTQIDADNFETTSRGLLADKNLDISKFSTRGFNRSNGKIVAQYSGDVNSPKGTTIEYYDNNQHQALGQQLDKYTKNLADNGFAIEALRGRSGGRILTVKNFIKDRTDITDYGGYEDQSYELSPSHEQAYTEMFNKKQKEVASEGREFTKKDMYDFHKGFARLLNASNQDPMEYGTLASKYLKSAVNLTEAAVIRNRE